MTGAPVKRDATTAPVTRMVQWRNGSQVLAQAPAQQRQQDQRQ